MSGMAVGLSYQEDIPKEFITEFEVPLRQRGLTVEVQSRAPGYYASLEWTIPTLVFAYLAKPYFEAFLSEAGKDHYVALKLGFLKLLSRLYGQRPELRKRCRSLLFSIQTNDQSGQSIKCIFPEGASIDQYAKMIDELHELLLEDLVASDPSQLSQILAAVEPSGGIQYIEYSLDDESWVAIDTRKEILAHANRSGKET